jgi:aryl-alcohol dehydrogenase-like predicted oxidoreductase
MNQARGLPSGSAMPIPLRPFGRSDVQVSALALGGHHLGEVREQRTAVQIVHEALDGGVTFFDNCWEYHRGKTELWLGAALKGRRDKAFVMTKVCTHGREGTLATLNSLFAGCRPTTWISGRSTAWPSRTIRTSS